MKDMPSTAARINVNMTEESLEELKRLADEAGMDMSQFVRNSVRVYGALRREIKNNEKHVYIGERNKVEKEVLIP